MKRGQLDSHILVLVTLGLTAFGLVMVYSATSAPAALGGGDPVFYLKRESIYAAIGVVFLILGSRMDYRALRFMAPPLMLASLGLCLAVLVIGQQVNGARRYGSNQIAAMPSPKAIAPPPASTRSGTPETTRIAPSTIPIEITVPRSGSNRISTAKTPVVIPIGRASSFRDCGAGRRAR